jgi:hypothetical protein
MARKIYHHINRKGNKPKSKVNFEAILIIYHSFFIHPMLKHGDIMKKPCLPTSESRPDMLENACISLFPNVQTCNDHNFNKAWSLVISLSIKE